MKKDIKFIEEQNERQKKFGILADKIIAYATAPFVALRMIRQDIMDPNQITEPINFRFKYNRYFSEHVARRNGYRMQMRAYNRGVSRINKICPAVYDPTPEMTAKGLEDILCGVSGDTMLDVRYFESTEHQAPKPMRCTFGEYMIDFARNGTDWCGGTRGNGYVFKININGTFTQIATISPELSEYLANIADEKAKLQKAQMAKIAMTR